MKLLLQNIKVPVFALFILLSACSKEGDPGPAGKDGLKGDQGIPGEAGEDGEDGEDGTNNIVYSDWFAPVWGLYGSDDGANKSMRIPDLILSDADISKNVVLVYRKFEPSATNRVIFLLPQVYVNPDGTINTKYETYIQGNGVVVRAQSYGADLLTEYIDERNEFRYVIIPVEDVGAGGKTSSPVDFNNYEEVKNYFNITD